MAMHKKIAVRSGLTLLCKEKNCIVQTLRKICTVARRMQFARSAVECLRDDFVRYLVE